MSIANLSMFHRTSIDNLFVIYRASVKVLSKIDGHLVQAAIVFGVGDVKIDSSLLEKQENSETTFIPESIARFPGLVGQTIVLGGVIPENQHKNLIDAGVDLIFGPGSIIAESACNILSKLIDSNESRG